MCRAGVVRALSCAPNWLAAESVSAAMAAASLSSDNASSMPIPKCGIRAENTLFASAAGTACQIFLPSIRHVCPDVGATWALNGDPRKHGARQRHETTASRTTLQAR